MTPELNREYPGPDEAQVIEEMVRVALARMKPQDGRLRRGQHAKATGCVRGELAVREDVPEDLRYGVLSQGGRSFPAVVRFSNASETIDPDGTGTARGIAVKLLDVDGPPAIPDTAPGCQDVLAVNHPVFPFATPTEYAKLFDLRAVPVIGDPLAVAWLGVFHRRHLKIIQQIRGRAVASPLEETYWSGSPFWLGPPGPTGGRAVKYSFSPHSRDTPAPSDPEKLPADYLSQAVGRHLRARPAVFDFRIQLQTDPVAMPVEDPSIEWDESVSKPIPVATLTIGVQDVGSPAGRKFAEQVEAMAFSPWNSLANHRPMGGINRLRRAVYLASAAKRADPGAM
jgi:hypothetical protein